MDIKESVRKILKEANLNQYHTEEEFNAEFEKAYETMLKSPITRPLKKLLD